MPRECLVLGILAEGRVQISSRHHSLARGDFSWIVRVWRSFRGSSRGLLLCHQDTVHMQDHDSVAVVLGWEVNRDGISSW